MQSYKIAFREVSPKEEPGRLWASIWTLTQAGSEKASLRKRYVSGVPKKSGRQQKERGAASRRSWVHGGPGGKPVCDRSEAAAHWAGDVAVEICVWKAFRVKIKHLKCSRIFAVCHVLILYLGIPQKCNFLDIILSFNNRCTKISLGGGKLKVTWLPWASGSARFSTYSM